MTKLNKLIVFAFSITRKSLSIFKIKNWILRDKLIRIHHHILSWRLWLLKRIKHAQLASANIRIAAKIIGKSIF